MMLLALLSVFAATPEYAHVELGVGSGYHAPLATLGVELAVRPLPFLAVEAAVGGAPASTNPDLACPLKIFTGFLLSGPCEGVQHLGPTPYRLSAGVRLMWPLGAFEPGLRLGVVRNPGAIRTVSEEDPDIHYEYIVRHELTPRSWLGAAAMTATHAVGKRGYFRWSLGWTFTLGEDLTPAADLVSRERVPHGPAIEVAIGARFL